ncbi:MAG: hypothetical protein V4864_21830 [Pseudomonadota bacterium]
MTDPALFRLPPSVRGLARQEAETLLAEVGGVAAVVIATVDGLEVGSAVRNGLDVSRVAALASSIAAIGEVVSGEARLGVSRSITVNTDTGFAVVHSAPRRDLGLVVNVISSQDGVLAHVNYRAAAVARRLEAAV